MHTSLIQRTVNENMNSKPSFSSSTVASTLIGKVFDWLWTPTYHPTHILGFYFNYLFFLKSISVFFPLFWMPVVYEICVICVCVHKTPKKPNKYYWKRKCILGTFQASEATKRKSPHLPELLLGFGVQRTSTNLFILLPYLYSFAHWHQLSVPAGFHGSFLGLSWAVMTMTNVFFSVPMAK